MSITTANRLMTIGVYGLTRDAFFLKLQAAGITHLCDIRARRGMRGSQYSFANSGALQRGLAILGIHYSHLKHLAPPERVRNAQRTADIEAGTRKRDRVSLSETFVREYSACCLSAESIGPVIELIRGGEVVALLCVEAEHNACHRSLVSAFIADHFEVTVRHL